MTETFCPKCYGVGFFTEYEDIWDCPKCDGTGEVLVHANQGGRETTRVACSPVPESGSSGDKGNSGGCGCS